MNNQELRIEILLEEVVKKRASDLHIQVGLPPMLRIDGTLVAATGTQPLDEATVERLVFQILDEDQRQILLKDKEFDFSFAFGTLGRFRVNAFHERGNLAAALRLIPNEIKTAQELVMALMIVPAAIAQLLSHSIYGMYLITVGVTVACSVAGFWAAYALDASTSSGLAFFYGIVYLAVVAGTVIMRKLRTPRTS